jgi:hypothetical protein
VIEIIGSISAVLFGISFLFILKEARKNDRISSEIAKINPMWPRLRISTICSCYKCYYKSKGFDSFFIINLLSFGVTIAMLFILIIY